MAQARFSSRMHEVVVMAGCVERVVPVVHFPNSEVDDVCGEEYVAVDLGSMSSGGRDPD